MNHVIAEVMSVNGISVDDSGSAISAQFAAFDNATSVDIHINFDNYSDETGWNIVDTDGNLIHEVYSYPANMDETNVSVCLESGCYIFTITDQWGDGICCNYGQGSYTVTSSTGEILASGGNFGDSESTEICLVLDASEIPFPGDLVIYPNPADEYVFIGRDNSSAANLLHSIRIYDISGRLMAEKSDLSGEETRMDISSLNSGVYVVEVLTEWGYARKKLVLQRK